jgi:site-specific recombinase XerD
MYSTKQLPLFPQLPASEKDINSTTALKHTLTLFQAHLQKEGKSEHTIKAFTSDLHLLAERLGDDTVVGAFTTTLLDEFLRWMESGRGVPCSRKTYARRVTTLKVYFKWLHELGAVIVDPAVPVLQRSGQAPLSDVLEDDEVAFVLSYADSLRSGEKPDARPSLLLRLLLETGVKKSETGRLALKDVQRLSKGEAVLLVKHASAKDIYKERRIDLSADLLDALDEYIPQYRPKDLLFTCTTRNLEYILEDMGQGAGLDKKPSFEMLRWTCAVRDYANGADPDTIREKLGLSKISWVETFAKIKRLAGEGQEED